jgi:hypothetical protein
VYFVGNKNKILKIQSEYFDVYIEANTERRNCSALFPVMAIFATAITLHCSILYVHEFKVYVNEETLCSLSLSSQYVFSGSIPGGIMEVSVEQNSSRAE